MKVAQTILANTEDNIDARRASTRTTSYESAVFRNGYRERQATVTQIWDRSYSHSSLIDDGKARPEVVDEIQHLISLYAPHGRVGVVAPKAVEEGLRAAGLSPTVPTAHFGALRGVNRLKNCDFGIVVGRPLPPEFEIEATARALFPFEPMDLADHYVERPTGYRLADGAHAIRLPMGSGLQY